MSAMGPKPSLLLALLCLLTAAIEGETNADEVLIVGNGTVLKSWQSSTFHDSVCYFKRTAEQEEALRRGKHSYLYFHSENKNVADTGYHWLVLELKSSVRISAVSIFGRNDTASETYSRAGGIEVWTSEHSVNFTWADHCFAKNMGDYFRETYNQWKACGETRKSDITMGDILTVNCSAEVKMLQLRRFVTDKSGNDGYMAFAGINLSLQPPRKTNTGRSSFNLAFIARASAGSVLGLSVAAAVVTLLIKRQQKPDRKAAASQLRMSRECVEIYIDLVPKEVSGDKQQGTGGGAVKFTAVPAEPTYFKKR